MRIFLLSSSRRGGGRDRTITAECRVVTAGRVGGGGPASWPAPGRISARIRLASGRHRPGDAGKGAVRTPERRRPGDVEWDVAPGVGIATGCNAALDLAATSCGAALDLSAVPGLDAASGAVGRQATARAGERTLPLVVTGDGRPRTVGSAAPRPG